MQKKETLKSCCCDTIIIQQFYCILNVCGVDPPSSAAGRTLTLVAKSVQNLANLVEFGAKVCFTSCSSGHFSIGTNQYVFFSLIVLSFFFNFQNQEPYMEGVNPFIKNNKHRMIMFLDELGVSEKKKLLND